MQTGMLGPLWSWGIPLLGVLLPDTQRNLTALNAITILKNL